MLFSTSLVALILSPRRLQITNTKVRGCLLMPEYEGAREIRKIELVFLPDLFETCSDRKSLTF